MNRQQMVSFVGTPPLDDMCHALISGSTPSGLLKVGPVSRFTFG